MDDPETFLANIPEALGPVPIPLNNKHPPSDQIQFYQGETLVHSCSLSELHEAYRILGKPQGAAYRVVYPQESAEP